MITAALAVLSVLAAAQQKIRVNAPEVVAEDERFNVVFVIDGKDTPKDFQWSQGDDFQLVWGPQRGSSTSISIVNGKRTSSSQTTYTYILLPLRSGTFTLPPATAVFSSGEASSSPVKIEVVPDRSSSRQGSRDDSQAREPSGNERAVTTGEVGGEDLFMRLSLSKQSAVLGEPLTATLKLYTRVDIVGFEGAKFPTFNGFWSQETESPQTLSFKRESYGGMIYNSAVLRRWTIIPQQAGPLTVEPAELIGVVRVRTAPRGSSIFDILSDFGETEVKKRMVTPAVKVNVSPLPSGAPADFGGGVGTFSITGSLSKDSIKTHDAASLVVTISGNGNISLLEAPKVAFPPDFETYDTKASQKADRGPTSGSKRFEYPFIARSAGNFVIPPVHWSYYNVNSGRYETVRTDSLRISVEKGTVQSGPVVSGGDALPTVDRQGVKTLDEDIRYIKTGKTSGKPARPFFVSRPSYLICVLVLLGAFAAILLSMRSLARRRADVKGMKNRRATKMALGRLRQADSYLKQNLRGAFYEELHRSLLGFVADKFGLDVAGQNRDNIAEALDSNGIDPALRDEFLSLVDACDEARYSPEAGHQGMEDHFSSAVKVISSISSEMKKSGKGGFTAVLALALLASTALPLGADSPEAAGSAWDEAVAAYAAGDYDTAAAKWEACTVNGTSADLEYNLGNAFFKKGDIARAVLHYERASRLNPSDSDIRFNLDFARSRVQDKVEEVPEFVLKTLMLKLCYITTSNVWAVLSLIFLAIALSLALMFFLGGTPGIRRGGFFGGIAALLVALMCLGFSLWQRSMSARSDEAIVVRPVTSARSTPSAETAKDLFILHEGTKVKILDNVGDYSDIELSDGRRGWLRTSDIEII